MIPAIRRSKRNAVIKYLNKNIEGQIVYLVPESLLVETFFTDFPSNLSIEKARGLMYYIVGKIVEENRDKLYSVNVKFDHIPLQSNYLKRILGADYLKYVKYFLDRGVLFRKNYRLGVHSYNYNIGESYQKEIMQYVEITYKNIVNKIIKRRREKINEDLSFYNDYADTLCWFTTGKLKIDHSAAENYLEKLKDRHFLRLMAKDQAGEVIMELVNVKFPMRFRHGLKHINDLKNEEYRISVDQKRWRLYSALTMMMSPLRNFLKYDEKELVAIDIKNSQAFHFCFILTEKFWSSQKSKCSFISLNSKKDIDQGNILFDYFKKKEKVLLKSIRKIVSAQPDDIIQYTTLTKDGTFYEYLSDNFKEKYPTWHSSREHSKNRFVRFLNFDSSQNYSPAYADYKYFKNLFPNVCIIMEALKVRRYTDISTVLSRLEAKMLLYYFVRSFADQYPFIPIFTVHDSIITLSEYKDQANEKMNEVYDDIFGFHPTTDGGKLLNHDTAVNILDNYIDKKTLPELQLSNFAEGEWQQILDRFGSTVND